ncbi:TPA: PRD domain-containing protein, partial [Pseudomonas aeruginosa]|nr:PRD domain-containing protein [Pseudomonas aeruginosa]
DLTETPLAEKLIYHIEMTYKISLSQFEIDFLCFPFNVRFIDTLSKPSYQSEQVANIFQGIVKKVKETMLVHFDDEELFEEIKSHLGALINRLIFHVQANDIFHGEVQTQYPFAFEMAKIAGEELSAILGSELELSEIGYLALYFEMIL